MNSNVQMITVDLNVFQLKPRINLQFSTATLQIQAIILQMQIRIRKNLNESALLATTKVFQAVLEFLNLFQEDHVMPQLDGLSASNKEDFLDATVIQHWESDILIKI